MVYGYAIGHLTTATPVLVLRECSAAAGALQSVRIRPAAPSRPVIATIGQVMMSPDGHDSDAFGFIFGSSDGSELEFRVQLDGATALLFEQPANDHLHLSLFDVLDQGRWRQLARSDLASFELSSDQHAAAGGSMAPFFAGPPGFFETRIETDAWCRMAFAEGYRFGGIRVHNRAFVLWSRAKCLRVTLARHGRAMLLLDCGRRSSVAQYLKHRIAPFLVVDLDVLPDSRSGALVAELERLAAVIVAEGTLPADPVRLDAAIYAALAWLYEEPGTAFCAEAVARLAVTLSVLRGQVGDHAEEHVLNEFLLRLRCVPAESAFGWISTARPDLINNRLYFMVTEALASERIRNVAGAWRVSSHGLFPEGSGHSFVPARDTPGALAKFAHLRKAFNAAGFEALLCYGALLGLVRDGMLLPHDDDIDVLVLLDTREDLPRAIDRLREVLKAETSEISVQATNTEGIPFLQVSAVAGIPGGLDIFFGWPDPDQPERFLLPMERVIYRPIDRAIVGTGAERTLHDVVVAVPAQPEEFFLERYGPGWNKADFFYRLREG